MIQFNKRTAGENGTNGVTKYHGILTDPYGGDSMKNAEVGKLSLKRKRTLAIAIALSLCCGCASAAEANGFETSEYFASY